MKKQTGHLQYDWWKYAAVLLIPLILWCSVFAILKKPKANERLHILFLGDGLNTQAMTQDLEQYLQVNTSQKLKSVQITTTEFRDQNFANQLIAATYSYDIIIISQPQMKDTVGQDHFYVLPEELRTADIQLYEETVNDTAMPFGAMIMNGEQVCYVFISPQTENLYPLNTKSRAGDNAAVIAWQWLMENL